MPFYEKLGFDSHPFVKTNADEEPLLEKYFVPPPFFDGVIGDPTSPSPAIVLAPRGGGKSAQRRQIEIWERRDRARQGHTLISDYIIDNKSWYNNQEIVSRYSSISRRASLVKSKISKENEMNTRLKKLNHSRGFRFVT